MKIAHIEQIPIAMPLAKHYDNHAGRMHMYDMDQHLVVKVHSDNGSASTCRRKGRLLNRIIRPNRAPGR